MRPTLGFALILAGCSGPLGSDAGTRVGFLGGGKADDARPIEWLRCWVTPPDDADAPHRVSCRRAAVDGPLAARSVDVTLSYGSTSSSRPVVVGDAVEIDRVFASDFPLTFDVDVRLAGGGLVGVQLDGALHASHRFGRDEAPTEAQPFVVTPPFAVWPVTFESDAEARLDFDYPVVLAGMTLDGAHQLQVQGSTTITAGANALTLAAGASASGLGGSITDNQQTSPFHLDGPGRYHVEGTSVTRVPDAPPTPPPDAAVSVAGPCAADDAVWARCWLGDDRALWCCAPPHGEEPLETAVVAVWASSARRPDHATTADLGAQRGQPVRVLDAVTDDELPLTLTALLSVEAPDRAGSTVAGFAADELVPYQGDYAVGATATPAQPFELRRPFALWPIEISPAPTAVARLTLDPTAVSTAPLANLVTHASGLPGGASLVLPLGSGRTWYVPVAPGAPARAGIVDLLAADGVGVSRPFTLDAPGSYTLSDVGLIRTSP
jgi:hypothetical protein